MLSLGAVALLLVGAWREMYSLTLGSQFADRDFAVDGWGRIDDSVVSSGGQHSLRLAIVTVAAAGLLLLGLALRLGRRQGGLGLLGTALGLVGGGTAAAAVGAGVLEALSVADNYRASLAQIAKDPSYNGVVRRPLHMELGGFVWLSAAAALAVFVAAALPLLGGLPGLRRGRGRGGDRDRGRAIRLEDELARG